MNNNMYLSVLYFFFSDTRLITCSLFVILTVFLSPSIPRVLSLLPHRRNKSAWFSFRNVPRYCVSVNQIGACQGLSVFSCGHCLNAWVNVILSETDNDWHTLSYLPLWENTFTFNRRMLYFHPSSFVCWLVCLFACLWARLSKTVGSDYREAWWKDAVCVKKKTL